MKGTFRPAKESGYISYPAPIWTGIFLFFLMWMPSRAWAQTAELTGSVVDVTGASIPGAAISVRNVDTGIAKEIKSDSNGFYSASALQPGRYSLVANSPGFRPFSQSGIVLSLDTSSRVDITLKPGETATEVTVTADASVLQTDSPEFESHVTSQQFDELPLVQQDRMRNPAAFVYLTPGVQGNITTNGAEYTGATNVIIANGSQQYTTELLLEGLPGGQSRVPGNYTESAPSVDAVREFKMTTTQLAAEYGHTGAAVGSFSVKSGTNQFHGSVYEYIRNSALDANFWLAKHTTTTPLTLSKKQNEFGATIGGPIRIPHLYNGRDRTFFFFAYGGSRLAGGASTVSTVTVPTADQRNGQFSSAIYDPATTTYAPNGNAVRKQFAGNKIDPSRFDPVAKAVMAYIPLPNTGTTQYAGFTGAISLVPDTYTAKVDHNLTDAQALSVSYVRTKIPRTTIGSPLPKPIGNNTYQVVAAHTLRVNHNWTINARLLNSAFVGFNRFTNANLPLYLDQNYTEAIGLKGIPDSTYFPGFTFSTNGFASISQIQNANVPENDFYYKDRITWSVNRHVIKAGAEYRAMQFNDRNPFKFAGNFTFHSQQTATQSTTSANYSGGNSFASFLLGQVFSGSVNGPAQVYTRKRYTAFFVQDDFRVNDRLTLNLGLRYEWQAAAHEARNAHSNIDLNAPNPGAGNLPGVLVFASAAKPTFYPNDYSAIAPRIGFAYKVNPTLVLRGGYGIFYSESIPNTALIRSGYSITGSFTSPNGGSAPSFVLNNGVPQTYPSTADPTPTAVNGQSASYWEQNSDAMPRVQQWSLILQQAIGNSASLEFVYIGNHGTRLVDPQMKNINQLSPQYYGLGSLLSQQVTSPAAIAAGIKAPYPGFTGTVAQALRPYPQYLTLTALAAKDGFNSYNAGQIVYRQRMSFGLTFFGGYVWSRNIGYSSPSFDGTSVTDNVLQNAYNPTVERSLLPQDVTHSLIMNYTYSLPFGKGHQLASRGFASVVAGGWKFSGIQRYQSGTPLFLTATNSTSGTFFNRVMRPNYVPGVKRGRLASGPFNFDSDGDRLINPAAFTQPANFTFGNSAPSYGDLRNFGSFTEDVSLVKDTQISERVRWSFYAQSTNVFNRHRFYGISTGLSSSTFGKPTNTSQPRFLQFGARILF